MIRCLQIDEEKCQHTFSDENKQLQNPFNNKRLIPYHSATCLYIVNFAQITLIQINIKRQSLAFQSNTVKETKNSCTINGDFLFLIFLFSFLLFFYKKKKKEHSFTQHRQRHVHTNHLHHEFYYTTYTGESDRRNQASSLRQNERTKSYFTYQSVDFF